MSDSYGPYTGKHDPTGANLDALSGRARGNAQAGQLMSWLNTNTAGMDPSTVTNLDPSAQQAAINAIARRWARKRDAAGGNYDTVMKNARTNLNQRISQKTDVNRLNASEYEWGQQYQPYYDQATSKASELMNTAAVSAEQEQALRGRIAGQIASSKASNLQNVASVLGLRGMANSPAAAAIASQTAEDYDREMISQLRDMGLQVTDLNRDQLQKSIQSMTMLKANQIAAHGAYLSNDREAVANIGRETAALVQALYAQDKTFELLEKQIKEANDESFADRAGQWVDLGQGVMNIAATGASIASGSPKASPTKGASYMGGTSSAPTVFGSSPVLPGGYE